MVTSLHVRGRSTPHPPFTAIPATARRSHSRAPTRSYSLSSATGALFSLHRSRQGLIGAPEPELKPAMEREHCDALDSLNPYETGNYHITTTSEIEWCVPVRGCNEAIRSSWIVYRWSVGTMRYSMGCPGAWHRHARDRKCERATGGLWLIRSEGWRSSRNSMPTTVRSTHTRAATHNTNPLERPPV